MDSTDLAYVAAFLDTDGWITVVPRNHRTTYGPMVGLVNRHIGVLEWVQSLFGGAIKPRNISRKAPHAKNWSQTYDLNFRKNEMGHLLLMVHPYLRIKREQAELVMEILDTLHVERETYRIAPDVRIRREEIYQKMRQLNHAGLSPALLV